MTTNTFKIAALTTVALSAIALPVMANHNGMQLRGKWQPHDHAIPAGQAVAPQSVYAVQSQGCSVYDPCAPQNMQGQYQGQQFAGHATTLSGPLGGSQFAETVSTQPGWGLRSRARPSRHAGLERRYDMGGLSVRTNAAHTDRMLDWQENTTGKTVTLLQHRKNGILADDSLYIGAGIKGGLMFQQTEREGQFPLLSRFPFFSDRTDTQSGVFAINNAALAITGTFGDWTTIYLQPEYSETDFRGDQDELQLRKAFVTFGNLDKTPLYAAFGRKTIDFGNFDGYNPFTQTEAQHYFWASSDQPVLELGYYKNGLKASVSAFSAGRQLRTAFAGEENNIGNYAASIEKEWLFNNGGAFTIGTSYLHDTIYRDNFTAHTFGERQTLPPPANFIEYRNSAASAFAEYNSPIFDAMVEYTSTFEPWAAAIPQDVNGVIDPAFVDAAGNIDFDERLAVTVAQIRYKPILWGKETAFSAVGSWGNISDNDYVGIGARGQETTFGENQQHALGIERRVNEYLDFGAEYVYNKGFIPFVAPQQVSNADTEAHAINVGFKARF